MKYGNEILCPPDATVRDVIDLITKSEALIAVVVDGDERLLGCVTDGDIRRAILDNVSLDSPVEQIMNATPKSLHINQADKAHDMMRELSIKQIPLLDDDGKVVGLRTWKDFFGIHQQLPAKDNQVFIMAGGKGTRLAPLTRIIPKPLVPLGDKTVIEHVMDRFEQYGFKRFLMSVNYKAELLKGYFAENDSYDVQFVQETEFLGTAGSLKLGRDKLDSTFFLINCDVLVDMDFDDALEFHRKSGDDVTIIGVLKNWKIPYGVIDIKDGKYSGITEKPEFDFVVNGGIYILEPHVVDLLEDCECVGMPDLIDRAQAEGMSVGVYPVSGEWVDIGEIDEYRKVFSQFSFIKE